MIIGTPKEIKNHENRVGLTPSGVMELIRNGHEVFIQQSAGENSGFSDADYQTAGAQILPTIEDIYAKAEMIVKVKEPIAEEYELIREDQLLFTYFHFASSEPLTEAMIKSKSVCLAYETVTDRDGTLPLLTPMSEVAGRMAIQQGAKYLEKPMGGKGILLGGVPGVPPAKVMILGGGVVGTESAKMAAGLGADVTILDVNLKRLRYLADVLPANVKTEVSSAYNIEKHCKSSDLIIGGVLIPGAKAPKLIRKEHLALMSPGTVIVDVAVDQGGCFETTKPTTHHEPIYTVDGIIHYAVANIPGAVPYTSTLALTNVTLPFVLQLANKGWAEACKNNEHLKNGLNIIKGDVVHTAVSKAFDMDCVSLETHLN